MLRICPYAISYLFSYAPGVCSMYYCRAVRLLSCSCCRPFCVTYSDTKDEVACRDAAIDSIQLRLLVQLRLG